MVACAYEVRLPLVSCPILPSLSVITRLSHIYKFSIRKVSTNLSLGLFEHHHPIRGYWAVQILMVKPVVISPIFKNNQLDYSVMSLLGESIFIRCGSQHLASARCPELCLF
ncbi:hypothetical protein V2G26_006317 [Clonostachys chloroleuca]